MVLPGRMVKSCRPLPQMTGSGWRPAFTRLVRADLLASAVWRQLLTFMLSLAEEILEAVESGIDLFATTCVRAIMERRMCTAL